MHKQGEINQPPQCVYVCARQDHSVDVHEDMKQDGKYPLIEKGVIFLYSPPNRFAWQEFSCQRDAQHDFRNHEISETNQTSFSRDISK
jgi:hypothetical protein